MSLDTSEDDRARERLEASEQTILDAARRCRNCNYCYSVCPIFQSTRGFMTQGPSGILQALSYALRWDLIKGDEKETLRDLVYACRTCNACVVRCKSKATGIAILDAIEGGRKILRDRMIGPLPQQRKPLRDLLTYGNPYGEKPSKRTDWCRDLDIKRLPADKSDVLLYVGCSIAFDPPLHRIARTISRLFRTLHIDFGIIEDEVCCGDPALRLGDDDLFQELREKNMERFRAAGAATIVTLSPHCFNTFLNEYPDLKERFRVQHYTEFLGPLITGLKGDAGGAGPMKVAYHDACYLGKRNRLFAPPRDLLKKAPGVTLVEMKKRMDEGTCCGGGGGLMFTETEEEARLGHTRVAEALATGADVLATACPWCFTMLDNAVKDLQATERIRIMDIAEVLAETIENRD